jgi:hypothetical protein
LKKNERFLSSVQGKANVKYLNSKRKGAKTQSLYLQAFLSVFALKNNLGSVS